MSLFFYKAKNTKGQLIEGLVEAASEDIVVNLLVEKNMSIIEIRRQSAKDFSGHLLSFLNRVKIREKVIFFRQLAVMIDANLPIVKALRILIKQTRNKYFKTVISNIADEVAGGAKLSQSMALFPNVFSDFYSNIVTSGETSGRLGGIMNYLADQQEKDYDLRSKIRGAMIYPAFILFGLLAVGLIMMIFVIPQMTQLLQESGTTLPLMTRWLIGFSNFFINYGYLTAILIAVAVSGFFLVINKTVAGRRLFDLFKIKTPIIGKILTDIYIVRITRSLNTLLRGGVPTAKSLRVVRKIVGNVIYEEMLAQTIKDVDEGSSLASSLVANEYLPVLVSQMVSVGEETGQLENVLDRITDFYTREIDNSIVNLSTLIEPIIMVFLGLAVGGFVAAVIMPMWQLSAAF